MGQGRGWGGSSSTENRVGTLYPDTEILVVSDNKPSHVHRQAVSAYLNEILLCTIQYICTYAFTYVGKNGEF